MGSESADRTWSNRVVGYGMEDPAEFLANPDNWRIHPHFQQDAVRDLLNEIGWVKPVIVNTRTSHVIDGHLRIHIALGTQSPQKIPVVYVDVSEAEEQALLATLDPLSALAIADKGQLEEMIDHMYSRPGKDLGALDGVMDLIQKQNGIETKRNGRSGKSPRMEMCVCSACGKTHYRVPDYQPQQEEIHHGDSESKDEGGT